MVADASVVDGPVTRWVAVATQHPAGGRSGAYELIAAAGAERRESLRYAAGSAPAAARCCGLLPLRRGVLVIGAVLLIVQLLMAAVAAIFYCISGELIRRELWPLLHELRRLNRTTDEQLVPLLEYADEYLAELERALLVVLVLSLLGAATCALLVHAARLRLRPTLVLPWLVWHGCLLVLGSAASAGGLVFGLVHMEPSWIGCAAAGLVLAPGVWYWFSQVFVYYLSARRRRNVGSRDAGKLSPLPTNDHM